MTYKIVTMDMDKERKLNKLAGDGWRVQKVVTNYYGSWTVLLYKDDATQTVAEKKTVSFETARKVLKIATKRTKLLKEILRSSKAFGYEVIVKKIEAAGLLLEEEDAEKELENDCQG